ncbi:MAG: hypothetical protein PHN55_15155 [Dysgonamonadaceae bacterium]|nr:hypothetical protein [Dysgonamonadaceae bacterium]
MGVAYKNFWSLNTDEAVVSGILRGNTNKDIEVLMPMNAQMKGIDLVLMNVKNKKSITIQVKGSRAYEPKPNEVRNYGSGSAGWFFFPEKVVSGATADYFAFLIYILEDSDKIGRRIIEPHVILIPTLDLQEKSKKYKSTHGDGRYSYKIWINPETKEVFDFRDQKIDFSKYLDDKGYEQIHNELY